MDNSSTHGDDTQIVAKELSNDRCGMETKCITNYTHGMNIKLILAPCEHKGYC